MRFLILLGLLLSYFPILIAQSTDTNKVRLTPKFSFNDGVYLSFEDFQNNQPSLSWDELDTDIYQNPKTHLVQLKNIQDKSKKTIDDKTFWGICIEGKPYVQQQQTHLPNTKDYKTITNHTTFVGLQGYGSLCVFSFQAYRIMLVPMQVTNPRTGKVVYTDYVENEQSETIRKMLRFSDGAIADFSVDKLKGWILDDKDLLKTVSELSNNEAKEKLYKCLLIYNDRHPVFVPN